MRPRSTNEMILLVCCVLLLPTSGARSQPPPGETSPEDRSDVDRAVQLRIAIGLGPEAMAALNVNQTRFQSVATAALDFFRQNRETLNSAFTQLENAQYALRDALTQDGDFVRAHDAVQESEERFEESLSGLIAQIVPDGSNPLRQPIERARANTGLDPLIRLLDLGDDQRSHLLAVTRRRDCVTRNPTLWHRREPTSDSHDRFSSEMTQILTSQQIEQLRELRQSAESNIGAIMQYELAFAQAHATPPGGG